MTIVFFIEGNIATGKSTILDLLEKHIPNCQIIKEPLHTWQNIEDTEDCLKEKLEDKFMIYEAHCYCIKDQNGDIHKKCMWRGIELQCGPESDMCNRQVVGSYGIPSYFVDPSDIVECTYGSTASSISTKLMENVIVLICIIVIVGYFD